MPVRHLPTRLRRRAATPITALVPLVLVDRAGLLLAGCVLLLTIVVATLALGAAFARRIPVRRSCSRTLDQVLRIVPWYRLGNDVDRVPRYAGDEPPPSQ